MELRVTGNTIFYEYVNGINSYLKYNILQMCKWNKKLPEIQIFYKFMCKWDTKLPEELLSITPGGMLLCVYANKIMILDDLIAIGNNNTYRYKVGRVFR